MRIKLSNNEKQLKESPLLIGLDNSAGILTPGWVREFVSAESWQAARMEIGQLQALVENIGGRVLTKEELDLVKWEIHEQSLNVDLSLILSNLATDILLTEVGKKTDFLILE
jgi:hypothetical protein